MILTSVEGLKGEGVLATFVHVDGGSADPVSDWGWQRRNATFSIAGRDYGDTPFGTGSAPLQPRQFSWQVLFSVDKDGLTFDEVTDALSYAFGSGTDVLLVAAHDLGYERVATGRCYQIHAPFVGESQVLWRITCDFEINEDWRERRAVDNTIRAGQKPPIKCGAKAHDVLTDDLGALITDDLGVDITDTVYAYRCGQGKPTRAILSSDFLIPTSIADATVAGPGGVPTRKDQTPTITIKGPLGGSAGFAVGNMSDPLHQPIIAGLDAVGFICSHPLAANETLTVYTDRWRAELSTPTGVQNVMRRYITVPQTQPYIMAILPRVRNQIRVVCLGDSPVFTGASFTLGWWRRFL